MPRILTHTFSFIFAIALALFFNAPQTTANTVHDQRALDADPATATEQIAPKLDGLSDYSKKVTTSSDESQYFFDQGLRLTYGFNHSEALRSFKEAIRLDPNNAMAYWGWALTLGPNLNLPMMPDVVPQAYDAIQKAVALKDNVSAKEQAFIDALAARYSNDPMADRAVLDQAYADAMKKVYDAYPDDDDAATLYAAALMNISPWFYWTKDGEPRANTPAMIDALDAVVDRNPKHPGALHYHIHATEAVLPKLGEKSADLLNGLMPGAGHMMHMPSHIYMRVGRYKDAYDVNVLAAIADEGYIAQCKAQGLYPLNYYPHNVHFIAWAAMVEGRSQDAMDAARKMADQIPNDLDGNTWGLYETFAAMPYYVITRFGMWDEALAEPAPRQDSVYLMAIWHYMRGLAHASKGDTTAALSEARKLDAIMQQMRLSGKAIGFGAGGTLLGIASHVVHAEIAAVQGEYGTAVTNLDRAVRLEDSLLYNEPPDWFYSVRQTLGATLIAAGRPVEAEVVYWDDLANHTGNGRSLYGLTQALKAQGRDAEAVEFQARFDTAWERADVTLTTSKY